MKILEYVMAHFSPCVRFTSQTSKPKLPELHDFYMVMKFLLSPFSERNPMLAKILIASGAMPESIPVSG